MEPFSSEALRALLRAFAQAFGADAGHRLAEALEAAVRNLLDDRSQGAEPSISRLEVRDYLRGSAFAPFVRQRVQAWALAELDRLPPAEHRSVAELVVRGSGGDVSAAVDSLVRYFAGLRFGL